MVLKLSIFVLFVSLITYKFYFSSKLIKDSPIVSTRNGDVKGRISLSRDGKEFYEYLGIPYAQPPIGNLRFENPLPVKDWTGVKLTQELGAECAQRNFIQGLNVLTEDCLFLNVFSPKIQTQELLPVIVFIHGGLFVAGSSNQFRGEYFMDENVVLITINYRLASLGFLNSGDGEVSGNMALKDQVLALKWIQNNIKGFGGDKNRVTIVGESAGSASVHYHILSPLSKGLFYRAISQSGTVLNPWALQRHPKDQFHHFAKQLDCQKGNSKDTIKCLKEVPIDRIIEVHKATDSMLRDMIQLYLPTVESRSEGAFLAAYPYDIIRSGKINAVPWMSGYNADEGITFFAVLGKNSSEFDKLESDLSHYLPKLIFYDYGDKQHKFQLVSKAIDFYFKKVKPNGLNTKSQYNRLFTDSMFRFGISESLKLHSKLQPVFPYYYNYTGQHQLADLMINIKGEYPLIVEVLVYFAKTWINEHIFGIPPALKGAGHADELLLLFNMDFGKVYHGDIDYEMSKNLVKLWVDFATGEKQIKFKGKLLTELNENAKEVKYLKLDSSPDLISEPHIPALNFWKTNGLFLTPPPNQ